MNHTVDYTAGALEALFRVVSSIWFVKILNEVPYR